MIKKLNLEKCLMFFILIQPVLDFYILYSEKITSLFKFSPTTIIRIAFVLIFTIYLIFKIKYSKKFLWLFGYLVLIGIYLVLHVMNTLNFNISIGNNFSFSYMTELFYFIRMFIPILLMYITYNANVKEENFRKTLVFVSLIFSLEIIITNILKVSLTSYGGNNIILGNIFDWFFNNNYKFEELASKGFFFMANQISSVLIMLLPINIYYAIKTSKKICIVSSFCLCLSMIMIGTRVGNYGWFLIALAVFIAWIFFSLIHKNKIGITPKKLLTYIILFVTLTLITLNSPLIVRETSEDYEEYEKKAITNEIKKELEALKNYQDKKEFVVKHSEKFSIPRTYINDVYLYENDVDFWIDTMKLPYSIRGGNRKLQNLMTRRVYQLNDNRNDKYFGMGYSRFRNAELYIEQDYVVHYYTIGIFGIILFLLPSFIIATYALIYMIIKKCFRMKTTILCMSVYLVNCISIFSGHTLDELIVTITLGFVCGYILVLIKKTKNNNEVEEVFMNNKEYNKKNPYVSVIVPIYNVEKYINKCLDSLVNQTLKNIEIILIDDGSKDKSGEILDNYSKKYKNIIVKHIENGGVSNARNIGISLAKGKYIGFIDSDDYIELDMFEKMYNSALKYDSDIVAADVDIVYPNYNKEISSGIVNCTKKDKETKNNILINSYAVIWNKIYKKSLIEGIKFKDKCNFSEDVEFLYKVLPLAYTFSAVNKPLYHYVQREGSLTYVYDKKLYQLIENFDGLVSIYKKDKKYRKYSEELEYSYVRYLYGTFVKRLAKTNDKNEFENGVNIVIEKVNNVYPNYKKNKYIKRIGFKNLYLKYFNKVIASIVFNLEKNKMN